MMMMMMMIAAVCLSAGEMRLTYTQAYIETHRLSFSCLLSSTSDIFLLFVAHHVKSICHQRQSLSDGRDGRQSFLSSESPLSN